MALTALVMVGCFFLWPKAQVRLKALRLMPAILVALLVGLVLGLRLEPALPALAAPVGYDLSSIALQRWPALLEQPQLGRLLGLALPGTATLALIMILESFTANNVMEKRFGLHIDANHTLVVLGGSNVVSALLSGVPCTGSTIRCVANWSAGGRGARAVLASVVLSGALLLALGGWLLTLPVGVVAGLFLLQAPLMVDPAFMRRLAQMLRTWRFRSSDSTDLGFWITLIISLAAFFDSLIWACFMGIGLSALAVLRRVSKNLTAQWADLDQYRSRRVRSPFEASNLARMCHRVGVLRLTGHLFFGNSTRLTQLLDELHKDATAVVIDVSQVHDVDSSGVDALVWLVRALSTRRLNVLLTGLRRTASNELRQTLQALSDVDYRVDLDHGLEAAEELLLQSATLQSISLLSTPLTQNHLLQDLSDEEITTVLLLGQHRKVAKGSDLFCQDTPADGVWLLEEGTVSILSGAGDDPYAPRLATFGLGQFVGEMGYIDGKTRSATARADTPVRALLLDQQAIARLVERAPDTALKITRNIARELSQRVRSSSALLADDSTESNSEWANSSLSVLSRF